MENSQGKRHWQIQRHLNCIKDYFAKNYLLLLVIVSLGFITALIMYDNRA
jgi:hypothetical protein